MVHNVAHFLVEQARSNSQKTAVRAPVGRQMDGTIRYDVRSFGHLDSEASATAHLFRARGIKRGMRVLLMVKPGLDLIRIVFALFKIGAVPIIIDPGMGLVEFLRCVGHSRPAGVVGVPFAIWMSHIFRASFQGVSTKVVVGSGFSKDFEPFRQRGAYQVADSTGDELATILFTSGSTGPAKGVCYAHGMLAAQVEVIRAEYGIEPGEVDLPMLPIFALFNPALGMCTVVPEMNPSRPAAVDPGKLVKAIRQNAITNSFGSPTLWTKIVRYCQAKEITLPSIRRILMAGAPVPIVLMERMRSIIPNGEIHTPYGATEALPVSSISATEVLRETAARTRVGEGTCVGRPLSGVAVQIIKPSKGPIQTMDRRLCCPVGEIGEIIVKGPSVTRVYDKLPQADAHSKITDGKVYWHRMGDMGWLAEDGRLWFCGRKAERVFRSKGPPLYTDCCEAIFNGHPKVFRSALIDAGLGRPAIVIEPEKNAWPKSAKARKIFSEELRELALSNMNTEGIDLFFFSKTFPVDVRHNAKIDRLVLAKRFGKHT